MSLCLLSSLISWSLFTLCTCFHTSGNTRNQFENSSTLVSSINSVLDGLAWTSIALIHDNSTDLPLQQKLLAYDITTLHLETTMQNLHMYLFPDIFVIVCVSHWNKQLAVSLLHHADRYDALSNRTTDFRHHSKWLIVVERDCSWTRGLELKNLQHVAFFLFNKGQIWGQVQTLTHHPGRSSIEVTPGCTLSNISPSCVFPNTKYKYNNMQLRVAVIESAKYTDKTTTADGETVFSGFMIDILHILEKTLNFSSTLVEPRPKSWGVYNGTWDGVVGMLHRREMDLAACDLTVTWERSKVIYFLQPSVREEASVFLYKITDESESGWFLVFRPLKLEMYLAVVGGVIVVSLMLLLLKHQCRYDRQEVLSTSYVVLAMVFRQSVSIGIDDCPRRFVLVSWWLVVIIVTSAYSAILIASLSDQSLSLPFTTIDGFLDSDYEAGVLSGSIFLSQKEINSQSLFGRIYNKIVANQGASSTMSDLLARVNRGRFAFLIYKSIAEDSESKNWQLTHLNKNILVGELAFATPQRWPLQDDFQAVLLSLHENGILEQLWKKWNGQLMTNRTYNRSAITVYQLGGGLIVVAAGLMLALLALVCECRTQQTHNKLTRR